MRKIDLGVARALDDRTVRLSITAGALQETFTLTPQVTASLIRELAEALADLSTDRSR